MSVVLTETDRLPWFADAHILQFPDPFSLEEFTNSLRAECQRFPYAPVANAGDLGWQGERAEPFRTLHHKLGESSNPVLSVRGNHDLKGSDIAASNDYFKTVNRFTDVNGKIVHLNSKTCLIGEDGAPDFRTAGNLIEQNAHFRNTTEISFPQAYGLDSTAWRTFYGVGGLLRALADKATSRILENLKRAFDTYECAVLVTHYPPFREAAYHDGKMGTAAQCPSAVNKRLGEELVKLMQERIYQEKSLIVLCGHTHEAHTLKVLDDRFVVHVGNGNRKCGDKWIAPPEVETLILPA